MYQRGLKMKLNPNEAPDGFIAARSSLRIGCCSGCYWEHEGYSVCKRKKCISITRSDAHDVIFIKKENEV